MLRVLIADDSAVAREHLSYLLSQDPAVEVVGAARNGIEVVECAARLTPDVIVMDVFMPGMDGHEAARQIMERSPTPIVMVSAGTNASGMRAMMSEAVHAGALTLVSKPPGGRGRAGEAAGARELVETVKLMAEMKVVKQAKQALRERELAQERERTRTRFLQIAAHELRNPMAAVKGVVSLLRWRQAAGRPLDDMPQLIDIIEAEVDRLSALLSEMLDAFRAQQGRVELKWERINLVATLRQALRPLLATDAGKRVSFVPPPGGALWLRGDARRLEEVFRNLLGNALKYSPADGEIRLRVDVRGERAVVTVQDNGIGIPSDQLARVFEGFFRASNLAGRDPGGLGLGLYICRDIVERHGGRIWAESDEGSGATFSVELPLEPPVAPQEVAD